MYSSSRWRCDAMICYAMLYYNTLMCKDRYMRVLYILYMLLRAVDVLLGEERRPRESIEASIQGG